MHSPSSLRSSYSSCICFVLSFVEDQKVVHEKNGKKIYTLSSPPSPLASTVPVADSSTRVDSPSHGLVTSSLCSPSPARLSQIPQLQPPRPGTYKVRGEAVFPLTVHSLSLLQFCKYDTCHISSLFPILFF